DNSASPPGPQEAGGNRPTAQCALGRKNVCRSVARWAVSGDAMFDSLSEKLGGVLDGLTRRGALSEAEVDGALREVRRSMLEADVALDVARAFTDGIKKQAVGVEVMKSVSPGQMVVKIVHDQLIATLGADSQGIDLNATPPVAIMMV